MNSEEQYKSLDRLIISSPKIFYDERGKNVEILPIEVNIGNKLGKLDYQSISYSKKNVLRGLHGDTKTWKQIKVLKGKVFFVAVDILKDSPDYGKHYSTILDADDLTTILLPPYMLNGHYVLSDECIFHYNMSHQYSNEQFTVSYKYYPINWPFEIQEPILSQRDKIKDYIEFFKKYLNDIEN